MFCCYNGKKFLKVLYLQNIYAITEKKKKEDYLNLYISSYFKAKKDCLLWEDNKFDNFHLSNRCKFSLFFQCSEGRASQLDTFSEDCKFFTEDSTAVTLLFLYFNWNIPLYWHLEACFHLSLSQSHLKANKVPHSRALFQVLFLFKLWMAQLKWPYANEPFLYLMVNPLVSHLPDYEQHLDFIQGERKQVFP